jgi:dienelactone hydrolase
MTEASVDWQVVTFGGAKHAFTNTAADSIPMPGFGCSATADARSWLAMRNPFDEVFGAR